MHLATFGSGLKRTPFVFLQLEASLKKWGTAYVYGVLEADVATVGTVDMWLYRCVKSEEWRSKQRSWLPRGRDVASRCTGLSLCAAG